MLWAAREVYQNQVRPISSSVFSQSSNWPCVLSFFGNAAGLSREACLGTPEVSFSGGLPGEASESVALCDMPLLTTSRLTQAPTSASIGRSSVSGIGRWRLLVCGVGLTLPTAFFFVTPCTLRSTSLTSRAASEIEVRAGRLPTGEVAIEGTPACGTCVGSRLSGLISCDTAAAVLTACQMLRPSGVVLRRRLGGGASPMLLASCDFSVDEAVAAATDFAGLSFACSIES